MTNSLITLITGIIVFSACEQPSADSENVGDAVEYLIVFRGSTSGSYLKEVTGENAYAYEYSYTDRGRGPELEEKITLDEQGLITQQSIRGVDYLKAPVDEVFTVDGETASWSNSKGSGETSFDGQGLYFRYDGSPAIYEILAKKLLASESKQVSLYPEGTAELSAKQSLQLSDGSSPDLLMVKGLDMNPEFVWMENNRMIARISGNMHIVRSDYEDLRPEMKALQDSVEDNYLEGIARELTQDVYKVLIKNVAVFTKDATLLPGQDVLVQEDEIISIKPGGSNEPGDQDTQVIDGTGKTLMPGLFDMHTHNTKFRGLLHLAGGITSVRDLANNKQLMQLSEQFNTNEIMGPRIVTFCGIIDGSGPYANLRNVVGSLEEGLEEVQAYKDLGYQQIKLYSSIRPEWVAPLASKAHDLGMRVSGHIPAFMTASQAIEQGYNEIQHINMLMLNFLSDTIDTRTPLRFTMVAQHGADLDLTSEEYLSFVELLKKKDILVDPTVAIFENMFISRKGEPSPTYAMIMDRLPVMNQRGFYGGGLPKDDETAPRYSKSFDNMLAVVADLHRRGVPIVPGTDGLPGFLYHRELELYVQAGISTEDVLKMATIESAEITGQADYYGSVEAGKKADLILVNGNPLENISDIRKIDWTMKAGKMYYADQLYDAMGIAHYNE